MPDNIYSEVKDSNIGDGGEKDLYENPPDTDYSH